jgi:hypothetical protein
MESRSRSRMVVKIEHSRLFRKNGMDEEKLGNDEIVKDQEGSWHNCLHNG